jgi:ankyrin repeat protein
LQLFTKENGKILKVAVLPPGIDHSHVRHPNAIQSQSSVPNTKTAIDISIPIHSDVSNQGAVVPYVSSSSSDHSVNSRALTVKPPVFPEVPMRNIVIPSDLEIASSPYVLSRTCNTLGNLAMQHQKAQALSEFIATYENEPWQTVVTKERVFGIKAFTVKKYHSTKPHAGQVEQAKIELADANQAITSLQQIMIDETQAAIAEARQKLIEAEEQRIVKAIENREASLIAEYHNILNKVRLDSEGNNAIHITVMNADNMSISAHDLIPGQDVYYRGGSLNIAPYGNVVFGERTDGYSDNSQKALNLIYYMISKDIDVNAQNNKGMTPFMLSCAYGQKYIAQQLILQTSLIDHSKRDNSGFDNFLWAVELREQVILTKLLQQGLNIDIQDNLGRTPLHRSCLNNYPELIKLLLERGANKTIVENEGFYPVHLAASKGNVESLIALAEYDSSLLEQISVNASGFTPLLCAAQYGQTNAARYLLSQNVDANKARIDTGATPLHMAIGQKFLDTVRAVIPASDIEKEDNNGDTAIMHSLRVQDTDIINLILDQGPNLDHANHDGITPLLDAIIYSEDAELVHLLLSHGATLSLVSGSIPPINGINLSGNTPLHISIIKNNAQIVEKLVPVSDLTVEDNSGYTPLLRSLVIGNEEIIQLIIQDDNCNPDAANTAGMTPLLFAVLNSNTPLVDLLITHGANPNLVVGNIPPINGNNFSGWYILKIFISATNIDITERISIFERHMTKLTYELLDDCGFDVHPPEEDISLIGQDAASEIQ